MLSITGYVHIDVDISDTYNDNLSVEVSGNNVYWSGSLEVEEYDYEMEMEVVDFVEQLSSEEARGIVKELKEQKPYVFDDENTMLKYDDAYARLSEAERAIMFNKLLKEEAYNAESVSLDRVGDLIKAIHAAGRASEVIGNNTITPIKLDSNE